MGGREVLVETTLTRRRWLELFAMGVCAAGYARTSVAAVDAVLDADAKGHIFTASLAGQRERPELRGIGLLDPATGTWQQIFDGGNPAARVSPDGRWIAHSKSSAEDAEKGIWLFDVTGERDPRRVFETTGRPMWASDNRRLLVCDGRAMQSWLVDVGGGKPELLPLPNTDLARDWSSDGKTILVSSRADPQFAGRNYTYWPTDIVGVDGTHRRRVVAGNDRTDGGRLNPCRFTPDGTKVVYAQNDPKDDTMSLWRVGVDGTGRECLLAATDHDFPGNFCVSPDGSRMAVAFMTFERGDDGRPDFDTAGAELAIMDADGRNRRQVRLPHSSFYYLLDWR
jgi:Tol biopolymer transport system component